MFFGQKIQTSGTVLAATIVLLATGCRSGQQPLTNPLAVDRVPAPGTRALPPGTAVPYFSGGTAPAAQPFGAPQTFSQPAPAFGSGSRAVAPPAFGQAQSPVIQAQPFNAAPPTFAQPQPFGQTQPFTPGQAIPSVAPPAQPFAPAPFTPPASPQGSGSRFVPTPNGPQIASAQSQQFAQPQQFFDDGATIAIPSDDQTARPVVAQQLLPSRQLPQQASPVRFSQPAIASVQSTLAPTNHVAATLTPLSPSAPPAGPARTSSQPTPQFSALPNATNLPWISGSAPRGNASPPLSAGVVQTAAIAPNPTAAPTPRVRLPSGGGTF